MLIFLGRSPSDITEYRCDTCNLEFDFRASDWERRADYLEPLYCPGCGKPSSHHWNPNNPHCVICGGNAPHEHTEEEWETYIASKIGRKN